jgi:hypothetical protein
LTDDGGRVSVRCQDHGQETEAPQERRCPSPHHDADEAGIGHAGSDQARSDQAGSAKSRLARSRRARRTSNPLPWIVGLGGLAVLVLAQVGVNVYREATAPGDRFPSQGNVHVALGTATPAYNSDPPTSGWHTPDLAPWGSYLEPQPDQRLVHNMEDGGVVLWYAAGTPEENEAHVAALEEVVAGRYARTVIAPREGMPTPYALTAWRRLQRFDTVDVEAKQAFLAAYHGIDHHPR